MKITKIRPEFVERIPENLSEGVLYICIPCNVAIHLCACGCNEKVVTPIDPSGWIMTYDGDSVSLCPSIGNWSYKCGSHYFIRNNRIDWLPQTTDKKKDKKKKKQKGLFKWFTH